jgi:hypothetical protein
MIINLPVATGYVATMTAYESVGTPDDPTLNPPTLD